MLKKKSNKKQRDGKHEGDICVNFRNSDCLSKRGLFEKEAKKSLFEKVSFKKRLVARHSGVCLHSNDLGGGGRRLTIQ